MGQETAAIEGVEGIWDVFVNPQTVVFVLCIYIMTYAARRVVKVAWKGSAGSHLYNEVLLPLAPIGNGMILAFLVKQASFFPATFGDSMTSKMMYGAVAGLFSGWAYSRIRSFVKAKLGGSDDDSIPPPAADADDDMEKKKDEEKPKDG